MHAVHVSFFRDPLRRSPEELLAAWPSLVDIAECAARGGVRVSVLQASAHTQTLFRNGIQYSFLPFGRGFASAPGARTHLRAVVDDLTPDVLHLHGLGAARDVHELTVIVPRSPVLLQDHADAPPPFWYRRAWRRGFERVSGVAFCCREQARPFVASGVLPGRIPVYEIPESSSRFVPGDMQRSRVAAGVYGAPLILWVGHLNENKDPLTVLGAFRLALRELPGAHLWCCFASAPLLPQVERQLNEDSVLRGRVHLCGRVSHQHVETLMRAADLFVLGSHHEGSGYSLIEALACGLPPVVTNIPSFHALTGGGAIGMLWPPGDAEALSRALVTLAGRAGPALRAAVRHHFEAQLSFDAVGRQLVGAYEHMLCRLHDGWVARNYAENAPRSTRGRP